MANQIEIRNILAELQVLAPAGYATAFHVRFTTPTFLFQTYPKAWLDYYSQNSLLMSDPTVLWGMENTGFVDWSELVAVDDAGVIEKAAKHGMVYGITCATDEGDSRSLGSFCRSDRPFSDEEKQSLHARLIDLHNHLAQIKTISPETTAAIRKMSVQFTHP